MRLTLSTAGVVAALALGAARSAAEEPAANPANAPAVASAGATTAAPGPSTASGSQGATAGTPARPPESTAPDSTSKDPAAPPQTPVESARLAYRNAWAQREVGDFDNAIMGTETALQQIAEVLRVGPDMTTRQDLTDLQSKLSGLRDAARHDKEAAASARESGNEADENVLTTPAVEGKAAKDAGGDDDIEPQINPDVSRYIEFFTGAGRSTFERWLRRSGRYADLFRSVLQKEGLPPDLVHLVFVESGFNLNARSNAAAVGPWQFLSGTARLFGLTVNQWVDERKDPEKSTVAAARYLKHLYSIFGDWPLALASYNAGEGTVLRAIQRQGTTNYWDLRLPRQTEDYVPQFMAVLAISKDPEKYGFNDVELEGPMAFDEIALKGPVDLRALARLADCSADELKELNPAVLRHAANGPGGVTTLRVPRGKGEVLMQKLESGAKLPAVDLTLKHRVHRHETLRGIADQYHVSARQLALANGIGKRHPLRRGMLLTVPASFKAPSPVLLEAGDPRLSTDYVPPRPIRPRVSLGAKSSAEGRSHVTVHRGQTLASIAESHDVKVEDIVRWNHLKSTRVRPGTRLRIRTGEAAKESDRDSVQVAKIAGIPAGKAGSKSRHRNNVTKQHPDPEAPAREAAASSKHPSGDKDGGAGAPSSKAMAAKGDAASSKRESHTKDEGPAAAAASKAMAAKGEAGSSKRGSDSKDAATAGASSRPGTKAVAASGPAPRSKGAKVVVVVKPGESLEQIARRNGVSVRSIQRANRLTTDRVHPGQKLKIPAG